MANLNRLFMDKRSFLWYNTTAYIRAIIRNFSASMHSAAAAAVLYWRYPNGRK